MSEYDLSRIAHEEAERVAEEFAQTRAARAAANEQRQSPQDRIAEGWDELDVVGRGWQVLDRQPADGRRRKPR